MAFTVDGPRGPRYEAKSGPIMLAKKTGNPILPFIVECRSKWMLKSWDRMQIPRPFSRVCVFFANPVFVNMDANDEAVEAARLEMQKCLDELTQTGENWITNQ